MPSRVVAIDALLRLCTDGILQITIRILRNSTVEPALYQFQSPYTVVTYFLLYLGMDLI